MLTLTFTPPYPYYRPWDNYAGARIHWEGVRLDIGLCKEVTDEFITLQILDPRSIAKLIDGNKPPKVRLLNTLDTIWPVFMLGKEGEPATVKFDHTAVGCYKESYSFKWTTQPAWSLQLARAKLLEIRLKAAQWRAWKMPSDTPDYFEKEVKCYTEMHEAIKNGQTDTTAIEQKWLPKTL